MTHQRTTSRLAFIARPDALRVARAMAVVRLGIGVVRPGEFGGRYVCELLVSLPVSSA